MTDNQSFFRVYMFLIWGTLFVKGFDENGRDKNCAIRSATAWKN